ncbi:MAG: hypothetical protein LBV79_11480, partial [Candidatus Adiutrix sp.]|nr:hypothetical protein [Candidatus Adiutrix sp.]
QYPAAGHIYLRLAALVGGMNRSVERDAYYRRAKGVAEALLKQAPDAAAQRELRDVLAQADSGLAAGSRKAAGTAPPEKTALPEADLLRLELAALASLGRPDEFQARLAPVLAEAAGRFGPVSQPYMRYYSLKLKGLEESGRVGELTAELTAQAADPPGRNEAERALNQSGALLYAARVNAQAGRTDTAITLYQQALAGLAGREEPTAAERRRQIEAVLATLTGAGKK